MAYTVILAIALGEIAYGKFRASRLEEIARSEATKSNAEVEEMKRRALHIRRGSAATSRPSQPEPSATARGARGEDRF